MRFLKVTETLLINLDLVASVKRADAGLASERVKVFMMGGQEHSLDAPAASRLWTVVTSERIAADLTGEDEPSPDAAGNLI